MRKLLFSFMLLFALIGCTNQEPVNENDSNPGAVNEDPADGNDSSNNDNDKNDQSNDQNGNDDNDKQAFDMTQLNLADLQEGKITGLPFAIGDSFKNIQAEWGIPVEEDYMRGGKFHHYRVGEYDFYFFDANSEVITGVQINPQVSISLDQIRAAIGTPDYDELDELLSNTWSLTYHMDGYSLFFSGTTEDANSDVHYMFLKSGQ